VHRQVANYTPSPVSVTPMDTRYYASELPEFSDVVETAPPPSKSDMMDERMSMRERGPSPRPTPPQSQTKQIIGEPDLSQSERLKRQDNQFFGKIEEMVTPESVDGLAEVLGQYGVDLPKDKLKTLLPHFPPLLKKYGNRVFGGAEPEKFVQFSAGATTVADFLSDLSPLIGAILQVVLQPPTDAMGNVVLQPGDENAMKQIESEIDGDSLSEFLQDGEGQGNEAASGNGIPADMKSEPRPMRTTGRGGYPEEYASPKKVPIPREYQIESLDELIDKERQKFGESFDADLAAKRRRDEDMKSQPHFSTLEDQLKATEKQNADLRAQPYMESTKVDKETAFYSGDEAALRALGPARVDKKYDKDIEKKIEGEITDEEIDENLLEALGEMEDDDPQ